MQKNELVSKFLKLCITSSLVVIILNTLILIFVPELFVNPYLARLILGIISIIVNIPYFILLKQSMIDKHNELCEKEAAELAESFKRRFIVSDASYQEMKWLVECYEKTKKE